MKSLFTYLFLCILFACSGPPEGTSDSPPPSPRPPVSVTTIGKETMTSYLKLNAISSYLRKESIQAPISGYIRQNNVIIGQRVKRSEPLFTVQTKEASALQSTSSRDSRLQFSGTIPIQASLSGVVSQVNVQQGAYVLEGNPLATISQTSSLVFLLSVPFEEEDQIKPSMPCQVILPNRDTLAGTVTNALPAVDVANQVENFVVSVSAQEVIPENLNAIVQVPVAVSPEAQTLPKSSVLTNETQTNFWVMQLVNDTTAIKISIRKGIETEKQVAIDSPQFQSQDRFISTGAYGLPDTAYVNVIPANHE